MLRALEELIRFPVILSGIVDVGTVRIPQRELTYSRLQRQAAACSTERIASIREVVDADGMRIVSNEVFAPGPDGLAVPAYALRAATLDLLADHGYDR